MIRLRNTDLSVFRQCPYTRTILRNKNMGRVCLRTFKTSKFRWNLLLWHDQTQKQEFGCFYTISVHKNHFKKEKYGQSLFSKHSKFQIFDEILYCGLTRFRNFKISVFRQYQNTRTILKKKNTEQNHFKKPSKFQKFQLSNFTLTWSNEGKKINVRLDMTQWKLWTNSS